MIIFVKVIIKNPYIITIYNLGKNMIKTSSAENAELVFE